MSEQIDLEAIRARVDEATRLDGNATPGPWKSETRTFNTIIKNDREVIIGTLGMASYGDDISNAVFAAASRTLVPQLAADCAALLAELERLRVALLQISQGAADNAGRCLDCDAITSIAVRALYPEPEAKS